MAKSNISTKSEIEQRIMIEWKIILCSYFLKRRDPMKKPADLHKNKNEYSVYLEPVFSVKYGTMGPKLDMDMA